MLSCITFSPEVNWTLVHLEANRDPRFQADQSLFVWSAPELGWAFTPAQTNRTIRPNAPGLVLNRPNEAGVKETYENFIQIHIDVCKNFNYYPALELNIIQQYVLLHKNIFLCTSVKYHFQKVIAS